MITTLLGTLFGGLFRMMPEILKWLDRRDDRSHELSMFDKQLEADRLRGEQAQQLADTSVSAAEIQAIVEATKAQAMKSGVGWVDALNTLMRPLITFWWVIVMYTASLVAQFMMLTHGGTDNAQAIMELWGVEEKTIVASIISFWFVDRSLRKGFGK